MMILFVLGGQKYKCVRVVGFQNWEMRGGFGSHTCVAVGKGSVFGFLCHLTMLPCQKGPPSLLFYVFFFLSHGSGVCTRPLC